MTMPHERTRALVYTLCFLRDLQDPGATPRVPRAVRERARALERHYPTLAAMDMAHMTCPHLYGSVKPYLEHVDADDGAPKAKSAL